MTVAEDLRIDSDACANRVRVSADVEPAKSPAAVFRSAWFIEQPHAAGFEGSVVFDCLWVIASDLPGSFLAMKMPRRHQAAECSSCTV